MMRYNPRKVVALYGQCQHFYRNHQMVEGRYANQLHTARLHRAQHANNATLQYAMRWSLAHLQLKGYNG